MGLGLGLGLGFGLNLEASGRAVVDAEDRLVRDRVELGLGRVTYGGEG